MKFAFGFQLIGALLMFQPDKSFSCDQADWRATLDAATWSKCPKTNTYLRGLWRNDKQPGDERVGRIEYGRCCSATEPSYTEILFTYFALNYHSFAYLCMVHCHKVWSLCWIQNTAPHHQTEGDWCKCGIAPAVQLRKSHCTRSSLHRRSIHH